MPDALDNPMLRYLFSQFPPAGTVWPVNEQARMLRALEAAFAVIYKFDDVISITAVSTPRTPAASPSVPPAVSTMT